MLICRDCGETYDDWDEVRRVDSYEYVDTGCGFMCMADNGYDECRCGSSDIVEAKQCARCFNYIPKDSHMDLCDDCLKEYMHDKDFAFQSGANCRDKIELNSFILHLFNYDTHKIEQVLKRVIEQEITITEKDLESYWEGNEEILNDEVMKND